MGRPIGSKTAPATERAARSAELALPAAVRQLIETMQAAIPDDAPAEVRAAMLIARNEATITVARIGLKNL